MKRILPFFLTTLLSCCPAAPPKSRHVLLIGIDGVRVDVLRAAETPNIDSLAAGGSVFWNAYAGGDLGRDTQQTTRSGPGWSSILTGVWANKHGVVSNEFVSPRFDAYPHCFKRIRQALPDAILLSIVSWPPINEHIVSDGFTYNPGADTEVAKLAAAQLKNGNPTMLFLQLEQADSTGHVSGFSRDNPQYTAALSRADSLVGVVLAALSERPSVADEQWLILITTDHGGEGIDHGGQTVAERRIFIVANGTGVVKSNLAASSGQVAIAPTILRFLEVPPQDGWGLESGPLLLE